MFRELVKLMRVFTYRIKMVILSGEEFDERKMLANNLRFILFLALLAVFYIANTRYAERNMRQINTLNQNLKELRWQYMTAKSKLMFRSKQSEVAKMVKPLGLEELNEPPKKIVIGQ